MINYHSITPPEYFAPWNNAIARLQVGAQQRLAALAPRAALGIADSEFISSELRQAGCTNIAVVPVGGISVPAEPSPQALGRVRSRRTGSGTGWLSVGRWAPNKAHHQTVAALFVARATSQPGATLTLIGSPSEPAYAAALKRYAAALGLAGAVHFVSDIERRPAGRPLSDRRCAGHALRPRGVRRTPGRGHGTRTPDRRLRRRRGERGPRRRGDPPPAQTPPGGGRARSPGSWPDRPSGNDWSRPGGSASRPWASKTPETAWLRPFCPWLRRPPPGRDPITGPARTVRPSGGPSH